MTEGVYEPRLGSDWDTRLRLEVYRLLERALGEERRARLTKAIRENIAQLAPDAFVLIPKNARLPSPGIVTLHSHDGFYLWGKEKLIESAADEHPYLTAFKQRRYGGKGIAAELARRGCVVIAIDMFY